MLWAILSILSGLGDSIIFALMKKLKKVNSAVVVWVQFAFALPFLAVLLYLNYPAKISPNVYWLAALNGLLLTLSTFILLKAIRISKLSVSLPLISLTPLFLLVISYFLLGEIPTKFGLIGVGLIVVGAYILNLKSSHGLLMPFKSLLKVKGSFYVIIVAFIWSITASMFKMGINGSSAIYFTSLVCFFASMIMIPLLLRDFRMNINVMKSSFASLLCLGIASAFMFAASSYAMASAIVPYVISLKRSSLIFSIFIGYFYFNERNIRNSLIGTAIMLLGGILITLF